MLILSPALHGAEFAEGVHVTIRTKRSDSVLRIGHIVNSTSIQNVGRMDVVDVGRNMVIETWHWTRID